MFGSIPALLAGIGGLTKAAGHFTGNRDLLKIGSAGQMLGAGLGQISDMTAGEGLGIADEAKKLSMEDGSIMSKLADQGKLGDAANPTSREITWLDDLLKDSKTSVFDDAYSKKGGMDTWLNSPIVPSFLGVNR